MSQVLDMILLFSLNPFPPYLSGRDLKFAWITSPVCLRLSRNLTHTISPCWSLEFQNNRHSLRGLAAQFLFQLAGENRRWERKIVPCPFPLYSRHKVIYWPGQQAKSPRAGVEDVWSDGGSSWHGRGWNGEQVRGDLLHAIHAHFQLFLIFLCVYLQLD